MRTNVFYYLFLLLGFIGFSQNGEITNHIYEGNKKTETEAYTEAEKSYRRALSLAPEKAEALYNLGNTHFLDEKYEEASQRFFQTQKFASNKETKHQAFHNMGNVYMQKKEYQKAVEAYKNALRNNPSDEETRKNLAIAKRKKKEQDNKKPDNKDGDKNKEDKDNSNDKKDEKKENKDKNKKDDKSDDKDKDKKDDKKDKGDKDKEDDKKDEKGDPKDKKKGDKDEDKKQAQPKPGQLSPQQIKNLLDAMSNQEQKVQDKINAEKQKGVKIKTEKDW